MVTLKSQNTIEYRLTPRTSLLLFAFTFLTCKRSMKRVIFSLASLGILFSANAEIEILYLAPNDSSPVLGSLSTDSKLFKSATPVKDSNDWMEVVREDYYSGFIAKDSLTADGKVEVGTSVLLTPSKSGMIMTAVEAGDEVTVNLVDDWTEITIFKSIPGYFISPDAKKTPVAISDGSTSITYARDPLLVRASGTRYTPPSVSNPSMAPSGPIAARGTTMTAVPMTGFEEVDSLNPVFGRTSTDGDSLGYSLGAGSTPMPKNTAAPFLDSSMEAPTSVSRIPEPTPSDPDPTIEAPTQSEEVDAMQGSEDEAILSPSDDSGMAMVSEAAVVDAAGQDNIQDAAISDMEAPMSDNDSEVIPLAPAAVVTGSGAAAAAANQTTRAEPIEEAPAVIIETDEEVEVANDVAESIVPGISQPIIEDEPPLIPPSDTNRIYIGKLQRTSKSFWGSEPPHEFELVNYAGDRVAYVDISEVPTGSYDKFTDRIVRVYGTLEPSPEKDVLLIKAANVTLQ